jgi:phage terminase large subunit
MPSKGRANQYTDRASVAGLGLFKNINKIKNASRKNLIRFDQDQCELKLLEKAEAVPHQHEYLTSWDTRYIGLSGGYGCGKSFVIVVKQILFCFRSPGCDHLFFEPSIPLLDDIAIPQFNSILEEFNIPFSFRRTPRPFYTLHLQGGDTRILLRSFENWEKIVGVNAASCVMDEIDTIKNSIVSRAIINIQARARIGNCKQQFAFGSTPEGYNFMYNFFMTQPEKTEADSETTEAGVEHITAEDRKLIFGESEKNPFVRRDYIDDIKSQYPPNIAKAYLTGKFVNMQTVTVFSEYERDRCETGVFEPALTDHILFGADFNVGKCKSVYAIKKNELVGEVLHCYKTYTCANTYELANYIAHRYAAQLQHGSVTCYPDATGKREYSSATESDHDILRNAGIKVVPAGGRNVAISAIVSHANNYLYRNQIKINSKTCFELTQCCEQWGYDSKTLKPTKGGTIDHSNVGDAFKYLAWGAMPQPNTRFGVGKRWR